MVEQPNHIFCGVRIALSVIETAIGTNIHSVFFFYVFMNMTTVCTQLCSRHPSVDDMNLRRGNKPLLYSSENSMLHFLSVYLLPLSEILILNDYSPVLIENRVTHFYCSMFFTVVQFLIFTLD